MSIQGHINSGRKVHNPIEYECYCLILQVVIITDEDNDTRCFESKKVRSFKGLTIEVSQI